MRVAAIYDIHGNLPALEAVLGEIQRTGVDRIVVGGDVIPGPMPGEAISALRELETPTSFLRGNGEREVLASRDGSESALPEQVRQALRWVASELSPEHVGFLSQWPETVRMAIPGLGDVLFCHATPESDSEIFTSETPEARIAPVIASARAAVMVCGHTHMQFDRTIAGTRVVNAGSVGMPFGEPGAYWLLLGPGIEPRRTSYDLSTAAERVRATDYPHADDFARDNVVTPPSEAEMLALFEPPPAA